MIAIVDYGVAVTGSLLAALRGAGGEATVTSDPMAIELADAVVLPDGAAFGEAMAQLELRGLVLPLYQVVSAGKAVVGIGLGMQLLFQHDEVGGQDGLGVFKGSVRPLAPSGPDGDRHTGWGRAHIEAPCALLADVAEGTSFYFDHRQRVEPESPSLVAATCDVAGGFVCAVARGNVFAVQFLPEASGKAGRLVLQNLALLAA